jgi:hypothetical protein
MKARVAVVVVAAAAAHQNSMWWNFRMVNRSDFGLFRTKFLHPTSLCRFAGGWADASEDAMSSSSARARLRQSSIFSRFFN